MSFSVSLPAEPLMSELAQTKQRLVDARAALLQACRDIEAQIVALEEVTAAPAAMGVAAMQPVNLFETKPVNVQQAPVAGITPASSRVIKAAAPSALDPALEQATLEELNAALSQAFAEIAGRAHR